MEAEKKPDHLYSLLLNTRTLVLIRYGILVRIEKELIRLGFQDKLKYAKRSLEECLLHNNPYFEKIMDTEVKEVFVDWDFELDKSVIVFIMNPAK